MKNERNKTMYLARFLAVAHSRTLRSGCDEGELAAWLLGEGFRAVSLKGRLLQRPGAMEREGVEDDARTALKSVPSRVAGRKIRGRKKAS